MTRTKVIEIDLTNLPPALTELGDHARVRALVRLAGVPVGVAEVPVRAGQASLPELHAALLEAHAETVAEALAAHWLRDDARRRHLPDMASLVGLVASAPAPAPASGHARTPEPAADVPSLTVAVCTRDRPEDLARCLTRLVELRHPRLEIVVVDNAPATTATADLVAARFPTVRYVHEPRPGLNWARNRAILESTGEIVAFADDDVVVARDWADAVSRLFAEAPQVMAMTGLVMPYELETEAQLLFERYSGFGKGFRRRWYRLANPPGWPTPEHHGAGRYGTGANMAFRRTLFDSIGGFDPALDVGTVTNGGGDLDIYFRTLEEGHTLVYDPNAVVWHRHREQLAGLRHQLWTWGTGFHAYLAREAREYPAERAAIGELVRWWYLRRVARRVPRDLLGRSGVPVSLVLGEVRGSLSGTRRYARARRRAAELAAAHADLPSLPPRRDPAAADRRARGAARLAVRTLELHAPLAPLLGLDGYQAVELCLLADGRPVGRRTASVEGNEVSVAQLCDVLAEFYAATLLRGERGRSMQALFEWLGLPRRAAATTAPSWRAGVPSALRPGAAEPSGAVAALPPEVNVSVVVATAARGDDLRRCLTDLLAQDTPRTVEILVVDNRPGTGDTAAVVAGFPGVRLLAEPRAGLSYARNTGIRASRGEVIVCTDDDVRMPPTWLEALVAPFARPEVGLVTGNVLPLELETTAQQLFERYGGLGRGFVRREADRDWMESFGRRAAPTWELGATANAAFRASVLRRDDVGLFDERLGAGTPTGCSEDTLAFYRVLRAGYRVVYEPNAFVWHRHRRTLDELQRQLHAYSRGHAAYHLVTWLEHDDRRAWFRLLVQLPVYDAKLVYRQLRGYDPMPWRLRRAEILGHLLGPWALWRSHRRVRRLASSTASPAPPAEAADVADEGDTAPPARAPAATPVDAGAVASSAD